nr:hypothetical protein [uncultured Actinotalea sp.]
MVPTKVSRHRRLAIVWGVIAAIAAATYAVTFWIVFDLRDSGMPGGPLERFVWPAAGVALVAFLVSMFYLARSLERNSGESRR